MPDEIRRSPVELAEDDRQLVLATMKDIKDDDVQRIIGIHQKGLDEAWRARTQAERELTSLDRAIAMRTLAVEILTEREASSDV